MMRAETAIARTTRLNRKIVIVYSRDVLRLWCNNSKLWQRLFKDGGVLELARLKSGGQGKYMSRKSHLQNGKPGIYLWRENTCLQDTVGTVSTFGLQFVSIAGKRQPGGVGRRAGQGRLAGWSCGAVHR
jgi:hypothetical protein